MCLTYGSRQPDTHAAEVACLCRAAAVTAIQKDSSGPIQRTKTGSMPGRATSRMQLLNTGASLNHELPR